ncbi:EVE domain-containing protein [Methylorubrum podarium]|jgi:EVE domain|uniref:EVE domain-containing protein n=1 Tax=Methylorubrum podarium TaxID=200476 RepID=UPI001EE2C36D|nr:EVE domain-containing protein [Methylorubrum podarium]GJE73119.1 hypothetical protein CHKEEEPN_4682 [Methylorubrum podarium]
MTVPMVKLDVCGTLPRVEEWLKRMCHMTRVYCLGTPQKAPRRHTIVTAASALRPIKDPGACSPPLSARMRVRRAGLADFWWFPFTPAAIDMAKTIFEESGLSGFPSPIHAPIKAEPTRKLPPTGYWIFVCNRMHWDGEARLLTDSLELSYQVSKHNISEIQVGDLGLIRINEQKGTGKRRFRPAGVYAVVEVIEAATNRIDDDASYYSNKTDALKIVPRCRVSILLNLVGSPIDRKLIPLTSNFEHLRRPLQTATIPISKAGFEEVLRISQADLLEINAARLSFSPTGLSNLEKKLPNLDPRSREKIVHVIERGGIGNAVKVNRGHKCQICEAVGQNPIAFMKPNGDPYAEAHHVQPVHKLVAGSLGRQNIMVLCPNHHRQAHHGLFGIVEETETNWVVRLDGATFKIDRLKA